jgi:hypothetical protein
MKANEAPEKIYIQSFNVSEEDEKFARLLYFDDVWTEEPELGETNIEYTRTDAFIEKARKWFEKQPELYDANGVRVYGEEDFEDFKKYIGE